MDLSAIVDEFNKRKAQAGQRIGDMFSLPKKPDDWFQQMQQTQQNAVTTPEQRDNIHKTLADIANRMAEGMVPPMIRERERAMHTDPSAAAKPFTSEEIKQATPFVTAAAPIATASLKGVLKGPLSEHDADLYHYHATNIERAQDIANEGKLVPHKPNYGTDQNVWPDRSPQKRSYFGTDKNVWQFAPEGGEPAILRVKKTAADFKAESTGDIYTTKPVKADHIEILTQQGWRPLKDMVEE